MVVLAALVVVGLNVFNHKPTPAAAKGTPTPTPTASASASAVACGGSVPKAASVAKPQYSKPPKMTISTSKTYTATMVTSCGTIVIRLDPKAAPNTVNSIVFLAEHRFYDGLTFHRIAKGFVIQGGDPRGNGTGGPGYTTLDTPPAGSTYPPGTVAMAKGSTQPAGTAGSQFFVVLSKTANQSLAPSGQGPQYAIVGHVIKGMDVVNRIAALPITPQLSSTDGAPVDKVYIDKVTIKVS